MNEWKILFIKGLPLEDKYFLELNQDKIDLFNNEFQEEEKKDPSNINLEILGKVQNINVEGFDLNKSSSQIKMENMEEKVKPPPSSNSNDRKDNDQDTSNNPSQRNNDEEINLVINCGNKNNDTNGGSTQTRDPNNADGSGSGESDAKEGESGAGKEGHPPVDVNESTMELPNSLISKIMENENTHLIQVDEANRNVMRGIQILDEKEFKNYLKGQKEWEYSFW